MSELVIFDCDGVLVDSEAISASTLADCLTRIGLPTDLNYVMEHYLGRSWQRWSRHLLPGQWRSGVDGVESYLVLIRQDLTRSVASRAA